mmetsp:Transcript_13465/g.32026  ORF Transcript_13465/g.32026 Transcript_13465/m.32026 type:complete len:825 (-) Transcript_13465:799-3273(-)
MVAATTHLHTDLIGVRLIRLVLAEVVRLEEVVRQLRHNKVDDELPRKRQEAKESAPDPLANGKSRDREGAGTDLDDEDLRDERANHDAEEPVVLGDALKHIPLAIELAGVKLVEELHENERVEQEGEVNRGRVGVSRLAPARRDLEGVHVLAVGQNPQDDDQLVEALAKHVEPHLARNDGAVAAIRLALELRLRRALGRERKRGERIHNEVYPEHLDGRQRAVSQPQGTHGGDDDGRDVNGELELQELCHGVVDVAAPVARLHDRVEVVIHQHNVTRRLGNGGTLDAHREADVGLGQRRGVVSSVARDCNNLAIGVDVDAVLRAERRRILPVLAEQRAVLQTADEGELVFGRRPGEHSQARPDLVELLLVDDIAVLGHQHTAAEIGTEHRRVRVLVVQDLALAGDGLGGLEMVARHHHDADAGTAALLDGRGHLIAYGVLHGRNHHEREVLEAGLLRDFVDVGALRKVLVGERQRTEAQVRPAGLDDILREVCLQLLRKLNDRDVATSSGGRALASRSTVLVGHEVGAARQDALGRSLRVHAETPALKLGHERHRLGLRREREQLHRLCERELRLRTDLLRVDAVGAQQNEQPALRRVAEVVEHLLALLRADFDAASGRRVKRDGLRHETQVRGVLLHDGRRHAGVADLLAAHERSHDGHLRGGQGTRLVRADHGGRAHGLARVKVLDQVLVSEHAVARESKGHRHGEGQTLRNGNDQNRDSRHDEGEHLGPVVVLELTRAARVHLKEEADEHHDNADDGNNTAALADVHGEAVELGGQHRAARQLFLATGLLLGGVLRGFRSLRAGDGGIGFLVTAFAAAEDQ